MLDAAEFEIHSIYLIGTMIAMQDLDLADQLNTWFVFLIQHFQPDCLRPV